MFLSKCVITLRVVLYLSLCLVVGVTGMLVQSAADDGTGRLNNRSAAPQYTAVKFRSAKQPASGGNDSKDAKDDFRLLQGSWKLVALERDGNKVPANALKGARWSFKGSEVRTPTADGKPGTKSAVKLDSSKTPKHIDLVALEGPQKGKAIQGIFKFEGDRLIICLRVAGAAQKDRPREFATKAGSELAMVTLERVPE